MSDYRRAWAVAALMLAICPATVAHRLDECLQATRIAVFHDHLTIKTYVTPGTLLAAGIFSKIDADGDGAISESEGRDYGEKFLRGISLHIDDVSQPIALAGFEYPTLAELSGGEAMIRFELSANTLRVAGRHQVVFQNDNDPTSSIYLANTMMPEDPSIAIVSQKRDQTQRAITIEYDVKPAINAGSDVSGGWPGRLTGLAAGLAVVFSLRWYLRRRVAPAAADQG